jgi:hypothetical protein
MGWCFEEHLFVVSPATRQTESLVLEQLVEQGVDGEDESNTVELGLATLLSSLTKYDGGNVR